MRFVSVLCCMLLASPQAFAWGPTGHRITGVIAEPLLSERARAEISSLLGNETLAEASTFADDMRSNPDTFWQKTANPWHYVTVPPGQTYAGVGAPPEGDAVTALRQFAATLRDPGATREDKQIALRFTVHIIGDLHQPLHAGNGSDRGGNDVQVRFFREPSNLHAVWDSGLIDQRQLSYTEFAAFLNRRITPDLRLTWRSADPLVWIAESAVARDSLYPASPDLSWDYAYQHRELLDTRLMQAGVRLADYLNALWP